MAGGHGGYRRPEKPAPVSGPGSMSKRTDGGPTQPVQEVGGFEYGGRQDFADIQGGAPMAGSEPVKATPLFSPTERPDEPITAGAPIGAGPGPAVAPQAQNKLSDSLRRTGVAELIQFADRLERYGI